MLPRACRLLVLLPFLGAWACAGKSVRNEDGAAGDAGEPGTGVGGVGGPGTGGASTGAQGGTRTTGGAQSSGGASGTATGGVSGTTSGGSSGTTSGGSSGTASGGSGTAGTSGTGTCPMCTPAACSTLTLPTSTINDFENLLLIDDRPSIGIYGVLDETGTQKPEWWLGYFSGSFAYPTIPEACSGDPIPTYPLYYSDVSGELRVVGTVGGQSGFGIWLGQCIVNMSDYRGIAFRIGGNVASGRLTFKVFTNSNVEPDRCLIGRGTCTAATAGGCVPAGVTISVPSTPGVVSVRWTDLGGGSAGTAVDPSNVVQLTWDFDWTTSTAPYEVDVTVDDVVLFN